MAVAQDYANVLDAGYGTIPASPAATLMTGAFGLGIMAVFFVLIVAVVVLKGFALWRAARNGHKGWFVAMLVINLMGILEIIYLLTAGKTVPPPGPVATPKSPVPQS